MAYLSVTVAKMQSVFDTWENSLCLVTECEYTE